MTAGSRVDQWSRLLVATFVFCGSLIASCATGSSVAPSPADAGSDAGKDAASAAQSDATLFKLSISAAPLIPEFTPSNLVYSTDPLVLGGAVTPALTTTVTAVPSNPAARIEVLGATLSSGVPSAPIPLNTGANVVDVQVTSADGSTASHYTVVTRGLANTYVKASNTRDGAQFGTSVALSSDGTTLAVGSPGESSAATGVGANQGDTSATSAGAVYIFTRSATAWSQQAYVKASNTRAGALFGSSVALSSDGATLAVGSSGESSAAVGVDGNQADTTAPSAGAVYVFGSSGASWSQQAYVKASNTRGGASFGDSVALSPDGSTLVVGSPNESSAAITIDGNQADTSAANAGAAYAFTRAGASWSQQAYVKASNARAGATFGDAVALSQDGSTLVVGSSGESSASTGIGGDQTDTTAPNAGAVYAFLRTGTTWSPQAYVKASNTRAAAGFGRAVALSFDGDTLAVGSPSESSAAIGVGGNQSDATTPDAGAAYVFGRVGASWSQAAYVKASNTDVDASFGGAIALSSDGRTLCVGSPGESSNATGINGNQTTGAANLSGAAYVFTLNAAIWSQHAYVKASNTQSEANFGSAVAISSTALAVGSIGESSAASGVGSNESNRSAPQAGAAYVL